MKEIRDVLKKNNICSKRYVKMGKCTLVESDTDRFMVKHSKTNIYDYLNYRSFTNYPSLLIDSGYEIAEYIEDVDIPSEQKMIDLVNLVSQLHKKTTYYKKISEFNIKEIYEDIKEEINDVQIFYDNLMVQVETSIYMRPSFYLLARNISFVYQMIESCNLNVDKWYNNIKETDRIRVAIIHNNLSLEHFRNNTLISWDHAKIGLPIIDLYKLYKTSYNEYDWLELLSIYNNNYQLKDSELFFFKTLISLPLKLNLTDVEIDNVREVNEKLNYLKLTHKFITTKKFETEK